MAKKKRVTKPVTKKKTRRKKKKNAAHYVDNEEFLEAMVAWKVTVADAEAAVSDLSPTNVASEAPQARRSLCRSSCLRNMRSPRCS